MHHNVHNWYHWTCIDGEGPIHKTQKLGSLQRQSPRRRWITWKLCYLQSSLEACPRGLTYDVANITRNRAFVHGLLWKPSLCFCTWTKKLLTKMARQQIRLERVNKVLRKVWGAWSVEARHTSRRNAFVHRASSICWIFLGRRTDNILSSQVLCIRGMGILNPKQRALTGLCRGPSRMNHWRASEPPHESLGRHQAPLPDVYTKFSREGSTEPNGPQFPSSSSSSSCRCSAVHSDLRNRYSVDGQTWRSKGTWFGMHL